MGSINIYTVSIYMQNVGRVCREFARIFVFTPSATHNLDTFQEFIILHAPNCSHFLATFLPILKAVERISTSHALKCPQDIEGCCIGRKCSPIGVHKGVNFAHFSYSTFTTACSEIPSSERLSSTHFKQHFYRSLTHFNAMGLNMCSMVLQWLTNSFYTIFL